MDDEIEKFDKYPFLESCLLKHKELGKRQRAYVNIVCTKLQSRNNAIVDASYLRSIEQLKEEKDELKANIFVADSVSYRKINNRFLAQIRCHVECQENLYDDIQFMKTSITNMEVQIGRMARLLYSLNMKTIPDDRHIAYVQKQRKRMEILNNNLEVGIRQEGAFTAMNARLREKLICILNIRAFFNQSFSKLVKKLNSDKKYMLDLIEYALTTFDGCIEVYEKFDMLRRRNAREGLNARLEMQGVHRNMAADMDTSTFIACKGKGRELADLQPKEYKRREKFREKNRKKVDLYSSIIRKIKQFTNSKKVDEVIEKFNDQESLYYSYFNYNNEMSYHVTLLNNSVNRLYKDIVDLRSEKNDTLQSQLDEIASLEGEVRDQEEENMGIQTIRRQNDSSMEGLLQGVENICDMCRVDRGPLAPMLGSHAHVNLVNLQRFLKLLESRVYHLVASVYTKERESKNPAHTYVVREVFKTCDHLTPLDDIMITQQCAECAETDAQNIDEGGDISYPHTIKEAKKKLYEKITQPEIQYRLHSISQCRLPHSRLLSNKRNA
ncbi:uncharacterized protein Dana_GF18015 [Drosophila ananassae]|uniref:ODAD1 central coiled coil region domain-containing protein n=1 Tax=Drosophila ananassae TaxID=7217 RepID=B3LV22_DROAN|nr:uncharacterized protein LOC6500794 [Drosophila ananassae]EDV42494.1 uncharacterized protein Dana_GF18015 [Drosophila ananassae]